MAKVVLPSNVEAERCVLGIFLLDSNTAGMHISAISEEDFSDADKRNRLVFKAMSVLYQNHSLIDVQTVTDTLINMKMLDDAGGTDYLMELIDSPVSISNIDYYIKIVKDQAILRLYLLQLQKVQDDYAQGNVTNINDFITATLTDLGKIAAQRKVGKFEQAGVIARAVENQISKESDPSSRGLTGIDTGFKRVNAFTHGWQKGNLIIVAARPSVGKTAFALNLATNATRFSDRTVGFFSCEMPSDQIMKRLISAYSQVPMERLQTGKLIEGDRIKISHAVNELSNSKLYMDDTPNPKIGDLVAKAKELKSVHEDLCLLVIDYINIIGTETKYDSKQAEVSEVTSTLKELARTLEIPVIALAQINRNAEQNDGRVPMLSNLKDSGSIEQDADIVFLMYRGDYYTAQGIKTDKPAGKGNYHNDYHEQVEQEVQANKQAQGKDNGISVVSLNVAKNRNGKIGTITLLFDKNIQKFDSPTLEFEKSQALKNGTPIDFDDDDTGKK